jgi:TonB-linked SusC/RagA family outer membrane protein
MKIFIYWLLFLIPLAGVTQTNQTISGKLRNTENIPLEGASIHFIKSKRTIVTQSDGSFVADKLSLPDTIFISYINYQRLTRVVNATSEYLDLRLSPLVKELEGVTVSNGYQRIPKERATGSYTFLTNKELNQQTGTSVLARLDGISNGVMFDRNPNRPAITIRGISTIYGNKNPLIIVDNFPYEGDINNINPDDVENISILKDAAAASIWGTRAGNGVIVISMKKGTYAKPLSISFNTMIALSPKPDLSYLPRMNSSDFIDVEQMLYSKGFYSATLASINRTSVSPVVELLAKKASGQLTAAEADSRINALRTYNNADEYEQYIYQQKQTSRYALSMDGGSQNATYHIAAGMDRNTSELAATFNKLNLYVDNNFRPIKNLQFSTSLYYTQSNAKSGKPAYGQPFSTRQVPPYMRMVDDTGNPAPWYNYRETYTDTAGAGKLLDWKYYQLDEWLHNYSLTSKQDMVAAASIQYQLLKGLMLSAKYQYERQQTTSVTNQDINSFATRDLINRFSQINRTTGVVKYIVPMGGTQNNSNAILESQNLRGQFTYNTSFGEHDINLLAGIEFRQIKNNSNNYRYYGYNEETSTIANIDLVNAYPNFINGASSVIPSSIGIYGTLNRYTSLFFNGAYTFRKTYTLSASMRKDESNLFGVNANERGVPLYSIGGSWQASNEKFYKLSWLPILKLRMTYGSSGNVDNSKSAVTTLNYPSLGAQYTNYPRASVYQFPNPDLRWEKNYQFNVGLDFAMNRVVSGSIEYYRKKGVDLFGNSPIDYTAGLGTNAITKNVANTEGEGWDIQLNLKLLTRKIGWEQRFIFNYTRAAVTKYYQTASNGSAFISSGQSISPLEGKPVYGIFSYRWAGLDPVTGDPMGYANGKASKDYPLITGTGTTIDDLIFSGSAVPAFWGNFLNSLTYKNWSLSFNITYKLGYYFRRSSINYTVLFNSGDSHSDFNNRWINPGDELITNVPSLIYPTSSPRDNFYNASEILVTKADHIRFQFVNLGYTYKKIQLYLNAANLGIIWRSNKLGIDPDYNSSLPATGVYSLGMKANF